MNTDVFSIELILNSSGANQAFVGRWAGAAGAAAGSWALYRNGFNLGFSVAFGSSMTTITSSASMFNNIWYHCVATLNGTAMTLYQDGSQVASGTAGGAMNSTTEPITVGAWSDGAGRAPGGVDEIAFYSGVVLNGTRIAAHNALK
jgi:hypothetical protein